MIFTEEDKKLVRKYIDIKNKGYIVSGKDLTSAYNRILEKNRSVTNCSSCLRSMVTELENALRQWEAKEAKEAAKKAEEEAKIAVEENAPEEAENNEADNVPQEEKEPVTEQINEENNDGDKQATPAKKPRGKAGRKKGSK